MKTLTTTALAFFVAFVAYSQNILVADNNPGAPTGSHVYSTLQAAVNAATAGDIIHVIPSATAYDNAYVTIAQDSISIYGIGFFPDKDGPQVASIYGLYVNANGVRISGLQINNALDIGQDNGTYSGITVENCNAAYIETGSGALSNILVRSCIVNRGSNNSTYAIRFTTAVNNSVISNCIIEHYGTTTSYEMVEAHNGTIIKNCIFYGHNNLAFENLSNSTVSNTIFYGTDPGSPGTFSNNVFNNNVAFNTSGVAYTLPPAGQTGSSNISTPTDSTMFADAAIVSGAGSWSLSWDPTVSHADAVGAGTDGTDIGVMGGTIPYSTTGTPLPLIQKLVVPEVIRQGENLNATIQAQGN